MSRFDPKNMVHGKPKKYFWWLRNEDLKRNKNHQIKYSALAGKRLEIKQFCLFDRINVAGADCQGRLSIPISE